MIFLISLTLINETISSTQNFFNDQIKIETENKFFAMMIEKIIHAPINLYFDVTPSSRIIRSFQHDIRGFDVGFIRVCQGIINCIFFMCYITGKALYIVPSLLMIFPPFLYKNYRF